MLLRKLFAALGPVLLCGLACAAFRWLDGLAGLNSFLAFALKGVLLGAVLALTLPIAGVHARTNGLTPWLLGGAGALLLVLILQFVEVVGANGQVVLLEGATMGYMTATALLYRRR